MLSCAADVREVGKEERGGLDDEHFRRSDLLRPSHTHGASHAHLGVSNTHTGVFNTCRGVSSTRLSVHNTRPSVTITRMGVSDTRPSVSNAYLGVSTARHEPSRGSDVFTSASQSRCVHEG